MSVNGTILSAPIGLQEVYSLLGVAKSGSYYDVGYICSNSHGKINPWAKFKPIRFNTPQILNENNRKSALYGLSISPTDYGNLLQQYKDGKGWEYLPPRPGTDWSRLADFDGYNHAAEPFLRTNIQQGSSVKVNIATNPSHTFTLVKPSLPQNSISISDFADTTYSELASSARLVAFLFNSPTPLTSNYIGTFKGDVIATSSAPSVTVDFSSVSAGRKSVVFGIAVTTHAEEYIAIPQIDNSNYWMVEVEATTSATAGANISISKIGFVGQGVNIPLTPVSYFSDPQSSTFRYYKMDERGAISVDVFIQVPASANDYTIYSADQFELRIVGGRLSSELTMPVTITSIGNNSYSGGQYTIPKNSYIDIILSCPQDTLLFTDVNSMMDGPYNFRLYDKRIPNASMIQSVKIYVDIYPYMS